MDCRDFDFFLLSVTPRERRVSRNVISSKVIDDRLVTPRERRVSRNGIDVDGTPKDAVTPRERRVSRNEDTYRNNMQRIASRLARGV